MTVESETNRNDYVGNGAAAAYSYTFRILTDDDLKVVVADTNGDETELVLDTDYTVSGAGETSGGTVTLTAGRAWMTSGFLTNGYALTIRRDREMKQETDLRNLGDGYPETLEDTVDHLVMLVQALNDKIERSMKLRETEAGTDEKTVFPSASERAGKVLGFDEDGNPVALTPVSGYVLSITSLGLTPLTELPAAPAGPSICMVTVDGKNVLFLYDGSDWEALLTMK